MKEAEIEKHFESRGQSLPEFYRHEDEEGMIFVAKKGEGPPVVFVHGSPGSWDNFIHLFSDEAFFSDYMVVAVDRPGFGRSRPRNAEPSLAIQARRIHDAVEAAGISLPAVWAGHSLAGPVVAELALEFPEAAAGLVLIAPSMDPDLEKRRWFNWVARFPLIKWGLSSEWRNSNEEIFPHKAQLEKLEPRLSQLRVPTIVLHGDQDSLVPIENAYFVERKVDEAVVELRILEGVDHFIPWTQAEEMKESVKRAWALAEEGQ